MDKDGKPLPVTKRYSEDVGRVLATVEGTDPHYRLNGNELYVRAVVTSSEPPENPSFPDQRRPSLDAAGRLGSLDRPERCRLGEINPR